MAKTDYRELMDKTYLGSWDIPESGELILTIDYVDTGDVFNESHKADKKMLLHFMEDVKPMVCNVTNAKRISKVAGSTMIEDWHGLRIILYPEQVEMYDREEKRMVKRDAIRVRDYAPKLPDKVKCADCGKVIEDHGALKAGALAEGTKATYGRPLCYECAEKAKKAKESEEL